MPNTNDKIRKVGEKTKPAISAEEKAIKEAQRILNERIEKLNKQGELIANREKFKDSRNKLQGVISDLGADYNDSLDQEDLHIQLNNGSYNNDKVLTVSNTLIVREFIEFISVKIDAKIIEIEAEILKG